MPKFRCEHCRQKIAAPDDYVCRRVRCPRCKEPVRVPERVDAVVASAPTPPAAEPEPDRAPASAAISAAAPMPAPDICEPGPTPPPVDTTVPSASPFSGAVPGPIITERLEGDLSSLFGDSGEPEFGDPLPQRPVGPVDDDIVTLLLDQRAELDRVDVTPAHGQLEQADQDAHRSSI